VYGLVLLLTEEQSGVTEAEHSMMEVVANKKKKLI
jgi:hypothetical protein